MKIPAALPALAILAGTAAACFSTVAPAWPAAVCLAAWLAGFAAYLRRRPARFIVALAAAFASGAWTLAARPFREAETPALRVALAGRLPSPFPVILEGRLRSDAAPGPNGVALDLDARQVPAAGAAGGGVRLSVSGSLAMARQSDWRAGRTVRVTASLREPGRSLDPGVPDSRLDLARRGTVLVGTVKSGVLVEVLRRGSWFDERAADFRHFARVAIASHVGRWSMRSAAIVIAILIGDRVGLDDDVQRALREAGTYHVIAISGGNIAILAGLMIVVLRVSRVPDRAACWLAIGGLAGYARLVGGGASVVRATLMAAGYLAARQADHRSPPLNALALACAVILTVTPLALCDVGFALTFGATLGILLGARMAAGRAGVHRAWLRAPVALMVASLSAELALFPVSAFAFSRVTFAGLLLNFAAIPLMTVTQIAGMAVLPLAAAGSRLASTAGWIAHAGADGLVRSAALLDIAPWLTWRLPPPHPIVLAAYYGGWCVWLSAAVGRSSSFASGVGRTSSFASGVGRSSSFASALRRVRQGAVALIVLSSLWILTEPVSLLFPGVRGVLRVSALDVGHADAVLVQLPDRRSLLVDAGGSVAGGSFDVGGRLVAPALWALGTRRLDALVISHGDPDHVGGATSVMRDFRPREVWEGIPVPKSAPLAQLRDEAARAGARWRQCRAGESFAFGEVMLRIWHPPEADWERQKVRNDDSLVIEVRYRGVSLVLPGDIGSVVERGLAGTVSCAPLVVLKIPHHGSSTSSTPEFLAAVRPSVAILSAGVATRVPDDVLARYHRIGTRLFRTSEDGAVTVTTDGHRLLVETYSGRRLTLDGSTTTKDTKDAKM